MDNVNQSILYQTLKWINKDRGFHICIHDTSGVFHTQPELRLPLEFTIHKSYFCDCAKTLDAGLRACLRCKRRSISKALRERKAFTGQCYLGVTEIVTPYFYNGRLICIIYIGNLVLDSNVQIEKNIEKICKITGVDSNLMLNAKSTLVPVNSDELKEYDDIISIISHIILSVLKDTDALKDNQTKTEGKYPNNTHWAIESVQNYISTYYNRNLKLSQLANLYFLNPEYLCRLFKSKTGTTFSEYVNKYRIDQAVKLLTSTNLDVIEISLQVGFNNVTYFNKLFKRYYGKTPSSYRKMHVRAN